MAYLPSPDSGGLYDHPLFGLTMETHLGLCPCGCQQDTVFYEDGSICLPQTVAYRDSPTFLVKLSQARNEIEFIHYLNIMRIDAAEMLVIRDELDIKHWSLLMGLAKPHILAICLMAVHDRVEYEALVLLRDHPGEVRRRVGAYLKKLQEKHFQPKLHNWIGRLRSQPTLNLVYDHAMNDQDPANSFFLADSLGSDTFMLLLAHLPPTTLTLLHMAKFAPNDLRQLESALSPLPNPELFGDETGWVQQAQFRLTAALTEYLASQLMLMSELSLDAEEYSDEDWQSLFK